MAIALVQTGLAQINSAGLVNVSFPSAVAAGNCVVVYVASWVQAPTTVSDNQSGNTYASPVNRDDGSGAAKIRIWVALNVNASGTFTVTVNFAGSDAAATVIIAEYSGVATASAAEVANTAIGTGISPSVSTSAAITDAGDLVTGLVTHGDTTTAITEAGTLVRKAEDNATYQAISAQLVTPGSTGVKTLSWTLGASSSWMAGIVALKPAAAASASNVIFPSTRRGGFGGLIVR